MKIIMKSIFLYNNRKQCFNYFSIYLNELILSLTQYHSDVLYNILKTLLSSPKECLTLKNQISIITRGFEIGNYNNEIMENVLKLTEELIQSNRIDDEDDFIELLKPLNNYLLIKDEGDDEIIEGIYIYIQKNYLNHQMK